MSPYRFVGATPLYYPGLGLEAVPGETVVEFDTPPDANWEAAKAGSATKTQKEA
jgi:hypothetical protein